MTNKKLLREIDEWEKENIIDAYAADRLRERYSAGGKITLVTIFSILSSILVGAGVILLFATNWKNIPPAAKGVVSFLPMIAGQTAALFTVIKKYENTVVRECVSILYTAGIFATLAMVGNSFDLVNASENYILICSVMTLPVIYLMSAVAPLAVFYAGVLFWAFRIARYMSAVQFVIFAALIVAGMLFILRVKNEENPDQRRVGYVRWLNVVVSLFFVINAVSVADLYSNATYLAYFALLLALYPRDSEYISPFKIFGVLGCGVMIGIFALGHSWYAVSSDVDFISQIYKMIPAFIICIAAVVSAFVRGLDKLKVVAVASSVICIAISGACYIGLVSDSVVWTIIANVAMLAFGITLIVSGTENFDAFITNAGLIAVGAIVIMRFFDWDLDIFAKGIAFIAAGVILFIFNKRLARKKKIAIDSREEKTQ